jgi:hypothetical protein
MADATMLAEHLEAYESAIDRHLQQLGDDFRHLLTSWGNLRECYEGVGADRFDDVWTGTTRRFDEYLTQAQAVRRVLQQRLEALRRFDQPSAP